MATMEIKTSRFVDGERLLEVILTFQRTQKGGEIESILDIFTVGAHIQLNMKDAKKAEEFYQGLKHDNDMRFISYNEPDEQDNDAEPNERGIE